MPLCSKLGPVSRSQFHADLIFEVKAWSTLRAGSSFARMQELKIYGTEGF